MEARTSATDLADWLLARGQIAVTTEQAAGLLDVPADQVRVRLHQPVRAGRMFSPSRGLWVAVPPQYRTWGAPAALEFLDPLMEHLGRQYYVGWLSAAEIHGAAHQRPQVTQVAVDRQVQNRSAGRAHLRFYQHAGAGELPRIRHNTASGQVWVSTPELTAIDLVDRLDLGGGVSNVATVLFELNEATPLNPDTLTGLAEHYSVAATCRLGFLLQTVGAGIDLDPLAHWVDQQTMTRRAVLDPRLPRHGEVDERWRLLVNTDVEPDL